jgi:hypothetical protein
MTERQARAMLDGEEYTPEGQIVEEFIPRLEPEGVLTNWRPDWSTTRTMLAMDLGLNNPHALIFAEDAERGRWVVAREWYSTGRPLTLGEFCRRINADCIPRRLWSHGSPLIPLDSVVTDPAGAAHSSHSGHSDLDMIAGARPDGLGIRPIIETIPERRGVATSLNRMRLAIERRRLMFSRELVESGMKDDTERSLARSLLGYRWDPRGREEPMKDGVHDHACFPAGTPVLMADGSWRPIEGVLIGHTVSTRRGPRAVVDAGMTAVEGKLWQVETEHLRVRATGDHPMFTTGGLIPVKELWGKAVLHTIFGPERVARCFQTWDAAAVFNLTVEDAHEYCAGGFWVSNCDALRYGARRVLWGIVEAEPTRVDHAAPTVKAPLPDALRTAKGMS